MNAQHNYLFFSTLIPSPSNEVGTVLRERGASVVPSLRAAVDTPASGTYVNIRKIFRREAVRRFRTVKDIFVQEFLAQSWMVQQSSEGAYRLPVVPAPYRHIPHHPMPSAESLLDK